MKRTLYMHTMNGEPAAVFKPRNHLCFAGKEIHTSHMATSLRELRKQQAQDDRPRDEYKFGYIRVVVDV